MNVLIVEDNRHTAEGLGTIISEVFEEAHCDYADRQSKAIELLETKKYDLFLLDIQLLEGSGYEVGRHIRSIYLYAMTPIVFITSIDEVELKAYRELHCHGFLSKPFTKSKIIKVLSPIVNEQKKHTIKIRLKRYALNLDINSISFIEAQNKNIFIYDQSGNYKEISNYSLSRIKMLLEQYDFMQCHRSYIINKRFVESIFKDDRSVKLKNIDYAIPIGRTYYNKIVLLGD